MSPNDLSPSRQTRPVADALPQGRLIGSGWRRFLAFAIDGFILYGVGRGVGAAFFNTFSRIGPWGHLVGFCIALFYFGVLDSRFGSGQTVGKRLMQLRVVDAHGNTISFRKSILRYSVFAAPYFLNGLILRSMQIPWIVPLMISVVVVGVGGSTLYLMIFNRHTRQGLHDLAVRSYVARSVDSGPVAIEPIWDTHWKVLRWLLTLLAVFFVAAAVLYNENSDKLGPVAQSQRDVRIIEQLDRVQMARVRNFEPLKWSSNVTKSPLAAKNTFVITVWWAGEASVRAALADQVAKLILENDPRAQKQDLIYVRVSRGYFLGIASGGNSQVFVHTPAEWHLRLFGSSPTPSSTPARQ